ncbi:hypothetical protein GBA52_003908, partial [Prunus armeniaca]
VAAEGVAFQEDWPYAIHLLGHIYAGDINSMRFLWKSMPATLKEGNPEVIVAWKIGQKLWMRDYGVCMKLFVDMIGVRKLKVLLQPFSGKFF